MKYFTSEWWQSGGDNAPELFAKYNAYLSSIEATLPRDLVEFEAEHTLHDAEVKRITNDFSSRSVEMGLAGWNNDFSQKIKYTVTFIGTSVFEQQFPQLDNAEFELGDIGYWEWELVGTDIEARILFASTAEFRLVFSNFKFAYEPAHV